MSAGCSAYATPLFKASNPAVSATVLKAVGRKSAIRGNFGVSLCDDTDPTTSSLWYSTSEGRHAPYLDRESLPPDYGWPVSGRLMTTQISLEVNGTEKSVSMWMASWGKDESHHRMELLRPTGVEASAFGPNVGAGMDSPRSG